MTEKLIFEFFGSILANHILPQNSNMNFSVIFLSKWMLLLQLSQFQNNRNGVVAEDISTKQEEYFRANFAWHKNQGRDVIYLFFNAEDFWKFLKILFCLLSH